MRVKKKDVSNGKITIDLTGPHGNAFYLLHMAEDLGKKMFDDNKVESVLTEMKSSDYENLVNVFDGYFGDLVILLE